VWPLTLVFSRKTLAKYQLIFRHLFKCKYVEKLLETSWLLNQSTKEYNAHKNYLNSHKLRQRMLHFIKNYIYHMAFEVFEPNFHKFKLKMEKIKTIDEVLEEHNHFLDLCLKESMLLDHTLFQMITKIIETSNYYAKIITRITLNIMQNEEFENQMFGLNDSDNEVDVDRRHTEYITKKKERLERLSNENKKVACEPSFVKMVKKFE